MRGRPRLGIEPRPAAASPGAGLLAETLDRAGLDVGPRRARRVWLLATLVAGLAGATVLGPGGAVAASVVVAVGVPVAVVARGDRRRRRLVEGLPELVEAAAREVRAGTTVATGFLAALTARPGLDAGVGLVRRVAEGEGFAAALERWRAEVDHPDGDLVAAVVAVGEVAGAGAAAALIRGAGTLRERAALRREVGALTAQARASVVVVAVAPVAFAVVAAGIDPEVGRTLVGTPLGRACLLAGLVLDGSGFWWMHRMIGGSPR